MKQIPLTQGQFAIVDDADFELVNSFKWCAARQKRGRYYAVRKIRKTGESRIFNMHRLIMPCAEGCFVDHKNGNGLDNRRENLRVCDRFQNASNRGKDLDNTSGFKGVFSSGRKALPWRAKIKARGFSHYLGLHPTPELAAIAYDCAAKKLHGEFAKLNFD